MGTPRRMMRIDDDVFFAVKRIANAKGISVSGALREMVFDDNGYGKTLPIRLKPF